MTLRKFFSGLSTEDRLALAKKCLTTVGHLQNIAYGFRKPSAELCVLLEVETEKAVTRKDLLPNSWPAIWPELVHDKQES